MPSLDNLDELRSFALVVETGSLSAAARALGVTTNAVSRRVMRLEKNLAVKVLRRSTRAVSVTAEGRALYARVRVVLDELGAAAEDLRGARQTLAGPIRLAIPGGACAPGMLRGLGEMLDTHPELQLQIRVVNADVDPVTAGFDVVLHVGPPRPTRLVARRLVTISWGLVAAPAYLARHAAPRRPQDLSEHRCLCIASGGRRDKWVLLDERGRRSEVAVSGNFSADDSRVLADAAYAGLGIGIRPLKELAQAEQRGELVRVLPRYRYESFDVYALMTQGTARLKRVASFLDTLRAVLTELV